jgi:hypothetical protein
VLLALTIISTVASVISALSGAWALLLQRRTKPQVVVIIADDIKASAVECQPGRKPKCARTSRRAAVSPPGESASVATKPTRKADTGPEGN